MKPPAGLRNLKPRAFALEAYRLSDWLAHIQRQHWRSVDLSLERIAQVWKNLAGKRSDFVIAVAGTNGKGSCVAMLAAALQDAGLKVGSYTSPHLLAYNERIRINGRAADDAALCQAFVEIEHARKAIPLTYFEFGTLCALLVFQRQQVEACILETGMGGRLDAVNLIRNDIALITSIGLDHTQWLGDSRERIAAEKAGILKPNALAVCAEPNPPSSIAATAAERRCVLLQNGAHYQVEAADDRLLSWRSRHPALARQWRCVENLTPPFFGAPAPQRDNLAGVVATLALTHAQTGVTEQNVRNGLRKCKLKGRCQVFTSNGSGNGNGRPEIIVDVAHNPASAAVLADFLAQRAVRGKTVGVFGSLTDKASADIIAAMRCVIDRWYFATLANGGHTAETLRAQLVRLGGSAAAPAPAVAACDTSPLAAYCSAVAAARAHDRVVIFGSFYMVGAILAHLEQPAEPAARSATA